MWCGVWQERERLESRLELVVEQHEQASARLAEQKEQAHEAMECAAEAAAETMRQKRLRMEAEAAHKKQLAQLRESGGSQQQQQQQGMEEAYLAEVCVSTRPLLLLLPIVTDTSERERECRYDPATAICIRMAS